MRTFLNVRLSSKFSIENRIIFLFQSLLVINANSEPFVQMVASLDSRASFSQTGDHFAKDRRENFPG